MTRPIGLAEEIFFALADLNAADRAALLHRRCGEDARLRDAVMELLTAVDAPDDGFLDPQNVPMLDLDAADGPLRPGTTLGGFLVLHAIGSGGMGIVYAAQQERPRRTVAIKVLRRGFRRPEILKRFEREAELLGRLQHPGIAQVFAFQAGTRETPAHLVMELVDGPPITEYAHAQSLGVERRVDLLMSVCDAVQHAHDRGVVHRDLKPANVVVTADGQPKVLDFGIARATGLDLRSTLRTSHGQLLGTVAYMSPEQLRGATDLVDERSDVYALGVIGYRLLAGRLPVDISGLSLVEAAQRVLNAEVPKLGAIDPALDGPLEDIIGRAMSPDRERRYQSAADLGSDLRAFRQGRLLAPKPTHASRDARAVPSLTAESRDHRFVAVGLPTGTVVILDSTSGWPVVSAAGDGTPLARLEFDADGRLAIARVDGRIDYLDVPEAT
jgi:eukaryotic-like serine/threonine-protein kinase